MIIDAFLIKNGFFSFASVFLDQNELDSCNLAVFRIKSRSSCALEIRYYERIKYNPLNY